MSRLWWKRGGRRRRSLPQLRVCDSLTEVEVPSLLLGLEKQAWRGCTICPRSHRSGLLNWILRYLRAEAGSYLCTLFAVFGKDTSTGRPLDDTCMWLTDSASALLGRTLNKHKREVFVRTQIRALRVGS